MGFFCCVQPGPACCAIVMNHGSCGFCVLQVQSAAVPVPSIAFPVPVGFKRATYESAQRLGQRYKCSTQRQCDTLRAGKMVNKHATAWAT